MLISIFNIAVWSFFAGIEAANHQWYWAAGNLAIVLAWFGVAYMEHNAK